LAVPGERLNWQGTADSRLPSQVAQPMEIAKCQPGFGHICQTYSAIGGLDHRLAVYLEQTLY
jgi:hypothetical protein